MEKGVQIVIGIIVVIVIALALTAALSYRLQSTHSSVDRVTIKADDILKQQARSLKCDSCRSLFENDPEKYQDCVGDVLC